MIAIIDGSSRAYGGIVLDFPRCRSGGGTIEEALRNAGKAVRPWAKRQLRTARNCSDSVEALCIRWL